MEGGVASALKHTLWDEKRPLEQRDESGVAIARRFGFGEIQSSSSIYFSYDHLGSLRERTDDLEHVVSLNLFGPFGTKLAGSSDVEWFAHLLGQGKGNLYLSRTRIYNSHLGIWLSRDPVFASSFGGSFEPKKLLAGFYAYTYCNNDPVNHLDPLGLFCDNPLDPDFPDCKPRDLNCCENNARKCKTACRYWVGPDGIWPSPVKYQECVACCHGKGEACKRNPGPSHFPGSHFRNCLNSLFE